MMQEFVQQINDTVHECLNGLHTAMPGKIVSYDAEKGTATVQPVLKFVRPDGTTMDYPQITGVPVLLQQGSSQSVTIAFPIQEGDTCLIVVSEQSMDFWMQGKETDTTLAFDITNAICIPGLFNTGSEISKESCDDNSIILDSEGTRIKISQDGSIALKASTVKIEADALDITAKVKLTGTLDATDRITSSGIELAHHKHTETGSMTGDPV